MHPASALLYTTSAHASLGRLIQHPPKWRRKSLGDRNTAAAAVEATQTGLLEAVLALSRSLSLSFPPYDVPWKLARSEVKEPPLVGYEGKGGEVAIVGGSSYTM